LDDHELIEKAVALDFLKGKRIFPDFLQEKTREIVGIHRLYHDLKRKD
jgi:hypothetical protein